MAADAGTRTLISQAQLRRGRGKVIYWTLLTVVVLVFTLVFLGPLYWMVTGALKSGQEIAQTPPTLFPKDPQLQNYADAWNHLDLAKLLFNTFYYAAGAVFFQLVFDTAAAYALSKLRPVFGNVILGLMLATLMIPAMVLIVPQYVTVIDLPIVHISLLDSPFAIWLPLVANAFNIFLLKRFFDSIPEDLIAAAQVDGASPLRTLWSIILPMSADPRRGVDLRGDRGLEGLPLAEAGHAVAGDPHGQRRHLLLRRRHADERGDRRLGHRRDPDGDHLPAVPAQHHVGPDQRQPQGVRDRPHRGGVALSLEISAEISARRAGSTKTMQKAGPSVHNRQWSVVA